jgi:hypothetical protein
MMLVISASPLVGLALALGLPRGTGSYSGA